MTLIQVHASELELKPKTYNESNPYKFKVSYTWTSEGQTIQSYDVSDNGQIAIAFSNQTIGVFDNDMNFLYQLSFDKNIYSFSIVSQFLAWHFGGSQREVSP